MLRAKIRLDYSQRILAILITIVASVFFINRGNAQTGEELFKGNCVACHTLTDQKLIGPGLQGINDKREEAWLLQWITNAPEMVASGDPDAVAIFEEYNKIPMLAYPQFSEDQIKSILQYISEQGTSAQTATSADMAMDSGSAVATTSAISTTNSNANGKQKNSILFWGILLLLIVGGYVVYLKRHLDDISQQAGLFPGAHHIKNFPFFFLILLIITSIITYLLYLGLKNNTGTMNDVLFGILPYVAFAIFIVGTIYRYMQKGYKVSSLSTQFIEGKSLFWGSQPFHWGLLVLFFGHLISFLFPSSVIAWNGEPVRLLILEISSFVFALSALLGLILLIYRRLSRRSLLVVTNKMDMVVYTVLLTQIISGLGVAYYVRWGSTWFSSVITPYLRSVFSLNPDLTAVSVAPIWIQLHIISAFLILAIIPFTRFVHFLVAPVDYIWRRYQLVLWNWNRKLIRSNTRHTFGRKPRNH